jgi:hypothetical protein
MQERKPGANDMDRETFIDKANEHLDQVFELATHHMKNDGLSCEESQRMCLFNRLLDVQQTLNGIESDDLV